MTVYKSSQRDLLQQSVRTHNYAFTMHMIAPKDEPMQEQQDSTPSLPSSISSPSYQSNTHRSDYMSVFKKLNAFSDEDEGNSDLSDSQQRLRFAQSDIIVNDHNQSNINKKDEEEEEVKRVQTHEIIMSQSDLSLVFADQVEEDLSPKRNQRENTAPQNRHWSKRKNVKNAVGRSAMVGTRDLENYVLVNHNL